MAELNFSQQVGHASVLSLKPLKVASVFSQLIFPFLVSSKDIDGLEVVGRGQPFSTVTVEDYPVFERSQESSSEDTVPL